MKPTKKLPLFSITGASCAGKTTVCNELFKNETDYIVLESDITWNDVYNTPEDDYRAYRRMWMKLCANISQIGKPCVVCGAYTPKQFENLPERELFSEMLHMVSCPELWIWMFETSGECEIDKIEKHAKNYKSNQEYDGFKYDGCRPCNEWKRFVKDFRNRLHKKVVEEYLK